MELTFLGTGAADFREELKGDISFGIHDKSVRRSTATLLDDKILFDCGPHVIGEFKCFNKDLSKVEHIIITHFHDDHFNTDNLKVMAEGREKPLNVWYSKEKDFPNISGVILHPLEKEEEFSFDGYTFKSHGANHTECPLHYEVSKDGKSFYYAVDGAWITYDTYYALKNKNFDAVIIDATVGDYEGDFRLAEHNSIPMIRLMNKSFKVWGVVNDKTKIILDHIAITLNPDFDSQRKVVENDGFIVSFDGMNVIL